MLRRLRGRPHSVYTAVTLLKKTSSSILTDVAETLVVMRAYADDELAAYVASGDPMDKAGAYAIQHGPQQDVPNACQSHIGHRCVVYPDILSNE